jgi:anti-sigma-K factor RskA
MEPLTFPASRTSSRWRAFAPLAIAVIAVAVAIGAWFRPQSPTASPAYTENQTTQAKTNVCSAYTAVYQGVVRNTHLSDPNPNDTAGQLAIAANARLALLGVGRTCKTASPPNPRLPPI